MWHALNKCLVYFSGTCTVGAMALHGHKLSTSLEGGNIYITDQWARRRKMFIDYLFSFAGIRSKMHLLVELTMVLQETSVKHQDTTNKPARDVNICT